MSGHALPAAWSGTLDDLSQLANTLLPQYLPLDRAGRTQDEVNPRLIRHYTTQGLLDPPQKEGRGAVYTRRHLLQLLALRRLMVEGHSAQALGTLLAQQNDAELEALLTGEAGLTVQSSPPKRSNPALDYLDSLSSPPASRGRVFAAVPPLASPLPASAPSAASSPYTRLTLAPGLELHVSRAARLPKTPAEQETLTRHLLAALDTLRRNP